MRFAALPQTQRDAACAGDPDNPDSGYLVRLRQTMTQQTLRAAIADLLSVKRPPVMNPCL
jgi:hypothetical protein